jgi:hypothetical protein
VDNQEQAVTETQAPTNPSVARIHALVALEPKKYELWKYYEDRADALGERLWSIGIWLMTVLAATLSLPFLAGFIKPGRGLFPLEVVSRVPAAILALFGLCFCVYGYAALRDVREHIESNWKKAGYLLNGTWESNWGGRKSHGWNVVVGVGAMAFAAFVLMFVVVANA